MSLGRVSELLNRCPERLSMFSASTPYLGITGFDNDCIVVPVDSESV